MATKTATTTTRKKTTKKAAPKKAAPKKAPRTSVGAARAKSAATATTAKPAPVKQATPAKPKRVSLLDAAATVLASATAPMTAKAIVDEVTTRGLWTSGKGKTPHATLYAAMIREIAKKETGARFKKVERGLFTAA